MKFKTKLKSYQLINNQIKKLKKYKTIREQKKIWLMCEEIRHIGEAHAISS
jgi:hypothetical protein